MYGLSESELNTLNVITKVSAPVGFLGVVSMAIMYIRAPQSFANPTGRIVLAITAADLLDCFVKFLGRWGPDAGTQSFLCQFQAAGIQESNFSSVLLGMIMGLNALYITYFRGSMEMIRKIEGWIILACFVIPIPFAIVPLWVRPVHGVPMYGDANQWCWFTKTYSLYQLYLWFIILWVIFVFNLIAFGMTKYALQASAATLFGPASTAKQSPGAVRYRMFIIKRMMAYMIAFVIVWTPSTANRIIQLVVGSPVFWSSVIQSVISPARGFFNFMAYFYTWWTQPSFTQRSFMSYGSGSIHGQQVGSKPALHTQPSSQNILKSSRQLDDMDDSNNDMHESSKSIAVVVGDISGRQNKREVMFSDATLDKIKSIDEISVRYESQQSDKPGSIKPVLKEGRAVPLSWEQNYKDDANNVKISNEPTTPASTPQQTPQPSTPGSRISGLFGGRIGGGDKSRTSGILASPLTRFSFMSGNRSRSNSTKKSAQPPSKQEKQPDPKQ